MTVIPVQSDTEEPAASVIENRRKRLDVNYPKIVDCGNILSTVLFSVLLAMLLSTCTVWADTLLWNVETIDTDRSVGQSTSIALDSNNLPHISYFDTHNHDLRYARFDGAQWNIETVDSEGDVGEYTSIAIDSQDHPHICYRDTTNNYAKYARWDGTQWVIQVISWEEGAQGSYISLALDSKDLPHVIFHIHNGPLAYTHFNGSHWYRTKINPKLACGSWASIAIDSKDDPHIVYRHRTAYEFFYVSWNGTHFITTIPDAGGNVGYYSSIALDAKDYPHISYFDYPNADLKYAWWSGTRWNVETVDEVGNTGQYTSLELDESGNPHIVYQDATNQDLKYAYWDGEKWVFQTIDSEGTVGKFASFAMDPEGHMYISYSGYNVLKYASTRPDVIYPVADAGWDQEVNERANVLFDGSGSYDTVGIASYEWTFTDQVPVTIAGEKPVYQFLNPGLYTVTLTVADPTGNTDTDEVVITVKDTTRPVAKAGDDRTVGTGSVVTFDGSQSTDNVGIVSYAWTFQDIAPQTLIGDKPTYTFTRTGRYTVTLTVEDVAGNSDKDNVLITVEDIDDTTNPEANAGDDQTVDEGTTVSFDGSKSYDDFGIVSYTWTFQDIAPQTLTGDRPTYHFDRPGRFVVTLTVEDAAGNSHSDDVIIT
ncbi:MAG: PKD domain-containing protein, partial [Theionarchaea archaeon]|nr:PKD domain-containing protein [Theionarchaea archaeon]